MAVTHEPWAAGLIEADDPVAYFFVSSDNIRDEMHREHEGAGEAKDGRLGSLMGRPAPISPPSSPKREVNKKDPSVVWGAFSVSLDRSADVPPATP